MTGITIGRWTLAFWLEALLIASALMLFGWMSASVIHFLTFGVIASLLLALGSLAFHEGSRHPLFHMLLYPIVAAAGVSGYLAFDSWPLALILAALCFWRIHSVASSGVSHANLQRRFVLALMAGLMQLSLAALFETAASPGAFDPSVYYGMLGLTLGSYLLLGSIEFVTREPFIPFRLPAGLRAKLGGQVVASHSLITLGFVLVASVVLGALGMLWSWVKGPLGSGLYWLIEPVLKQLAAWSESLTGAFEKDGRVNDLLDNQGQGSDASYLPDAQGEPLISLLEPYLLAAAALIVVALLGRAIWKRRFRKNGSLEETAPAVTPTAWSPLAEGESDQPLWDVRKWFQKAPGPSDDPVRYAYYQFLQHAAALGKPIYRYETSQEYLRRLMQQWQDPDRLRLAAQITDCYEWYRYHEQSLTPDELAAMQQAVKALREKREA